MDSSKIPPPSDDAPETPAEQFSSEEIQEFDDHHTKPLRLPDAELRRSLWLINVSWGWFGAAWMAVVMGAPFTAFAKYLGAGEFALGALSSLRFLAISAQVIGSYWVERTRNRKRIFFMMHIPARSTWLLVAALPLIIPNGMVDLRVGAFMLVLFCFSIMDAIASVAWNPWVADIIPDRVRARYLSQRQRISTVTALLAATGAAWLLDRQPEGAGYMYTILFAVAAVCGLIDVLMYFFVPNVPMIKRPALRLSEVMRKPLADLRFRSYLVYTASTTVSGSIFGTFIWLYAFDVLKLSKSESNLYIVIISSIATIVTTRAGGTLADRFGSKSVLLVSWIGMVITPFLWALATPHSRGLMIAASILGGVSGGITMMLALNMTFSYTPRAARSAYIALNSMASGLAGFIAPMLVGGIAESIKHIQVDFLWWHFGNLHLMFIFVGFYRLAHMLIIVPRLPEERKTTSARQMLRELITGWSRPRV